jgi:GTP-binding protein EngB required for normal cell division
MKRSLDGLRTDLRQVLDILSRERAPVFLDGEAEDIRRAAAALSQKLDDFSDSTLSVGLLGGTGVGKSSLMNGLARSEIASASHRRPHTDRVLVYRHRSSVLPSSILHTHVPWKEHVHGADAVSQIILCDLPDFDSLQELHRQYVKDFLEHLDLLVWVVTPEKYADERFYSFLNEVPKSRENFLFVVNKVDQLFGGLELEMGYQMLARLVKTFHRHLAERAAVEHSIIYCVSALDALENPEPAAWNQFNAFRHQVFHERDAKEVGAIKTANLDQELEMLLVTMDEMAFQAGKLETLLRDFASELANERADWIRSGQEVLGEWIGTAVKSRVRDTLLQKSDLVGVGSVVQNILGRLEMKNEPGSGASSLTWQLTRDGVLGRLVDQWARLENRMVHRALQEGISTNLLAPVQTLLNPDERWARWVHSLRSALDATMADMPLSSSKGFRWMQHGAYSLLFALLIVGISLQSWGDVTRGGNVWEAGLMWLIGSVRVLFSAQGLSALASYCVLLLLLGLRFQLSHKKRLQRQEQTIIEALKVDLGHIWDMEFNGVISDLREHGKQLAREVEEISSLRQRREKD